MRWWCVSMSTMQNKCSTMVEMLAYFLFVSKLFIIIIEQCVGPLTGLATTEVHSLPAILFIRRRRNARMIGRRWLCTTIRIRLLMWLWLLLSGHRIQQSQFACLIFLLCLLAPQCHLIRNKTKPFLQHLENKSFDIHSIHYFSPVRPWRVDVLRSMCIWRKHNLATDNIVCGPSVRSPV